MMSDRSTEASVPLRRRLGLPLLVLYGTGITVGAGIYVLIGAVAGHAGIYTPWSFVLAAAGMGLTVASYAELSTRFPVSAGEAAYVRAALGSHRSRTDRRSADRCYRGDFLGCRNAWIRRLYPAIRRFSQIYNRDCGPDDLEPWHAGDYLRSVVLASIFTLIEVGGLVIVVVAAVSADLPIVATTAHMPPLNATGLSRSPSVVCSHFLLLSASRTLQTLSRKRRFWHRTSRAP